MSTPDNSKAMVVTHRFPTIDSNNLFVVSREIRINHEGEEYRLWITSNNKLILTK